jgi:hypothetical protein
VAIALSEMGIMTVGALRASNQGAAKGRIQTLAQHPIDQGLRNRNFYLKQDEFSR